MEIIKKDGQVVNYDSEKINLAVEKAMKNSYKGEEIPNPNLPSSIVALVENYVSNYEGDKIPIVELQSEIEDYLMSFDKDVARTFIEFRNKRDVERKGMLDVTKSVERVINKDKEVMNENANKNSDFFHVRRDLTAGSVAKPIGLKMLPKKVANAHIKGDIHFHDLDYHPYTPLTNCCLIDFEGMFRDGTRIGNADIETPKSIQTAVAQAAQIIANVSSNQYGGASFDRMDETLAPFAEMNFKKHMADAKKWIDDESKHEAYAYEKTEKDIYDSIQSLEYEINTLFNANGQTAFFTVGFGLGTNWYEREIQKAIFTNRMKGLGKEGKVAIFPKLVFSLKRGLNLEPNDPNYDIKKLAMECTSKCMYPDVINYEKLIELTGSFKAPMGK